jgi:hypothetical protein
MLFHHINAFILIIFSLFYNFLPIGAMVFFVHDLSDSFRAFSRAIGDSKLCILYPWFSDLWNISFLLVWIYLRVIMLSFCLIDSMYNSIPSEDSIWRTVYSQHICLIVLSFANYFIQCYWALLIYLNLKPERENNKYFVN